MVSCINCKHRLRMLSDVGNEKFWACGHRYGEFLQVDNPEYSKTASSEVLESMVKVDPYVDRECGYSEMG